MTKLISTVGVRQYPTEQFKGGVMLAALVLVCSVSVTPDPRDCTAENARAVMHVPAEFASLAMCLMNEVGGPAPINLLCSVPSRTI